ncbi:MAG: hypothetical protein AAGF83_05815 [Cyanobacteria bacterium P01_G01_bin.67]
MFKQSMSLMIAPVIIGLYTGLANADEVKVKAGNMQVSVQNGNVEVNSGSTAVKAPSLLNRLSNLRLFGDRQTSPRVNPSRSSTRSSNLKCDHRSSGYSSTRRNQSGTAVSQTRSSSTTMTCN